MFKALFMSTAFTCFSSFPQRNSKTDLSLLSDLYSSLLLYTEKFLHWGFFPWNPVFLGAVLLSVNHPIALIGFAPLHLILVCTQRVSVLSNIKAVFSRTSHGYGDPKTQHMPESQACFNPGWPPVASLMMALCEFASVILTLNSKVR